jgi:hypothetical protein
MGSGHANNFLAGKIQNGVISAVCDVNEAKFAFFKEKFGESSLFANEKDDSFKSSIGQIYQTFGGEELYPSAEEKAAMLLYLVTKNHSFSDGNKRIAATLFLWFMNNNGILYRPRRHQAPGRQYSRGPHADDCRKPHRRERCDGEGSGESD